LTQNLTSRRIVAGRLPLLAAAAVCLLLLALSSPALAQHGGGGGRAMGGNPGGMMGNPRSMMGERGGNMRPNDAGGFGRSNRGSQGQSRMGLQLGLSGRWWDDHGTARKLRLNSDQQTRMDSIFEANRPALTNLYGNLQHEEANLAGLSHADLQDETKVFAAIDRVSHARSDLEKQYAHMLLQMRQQLDPQQLDALDHQIASSH
jgi:Spy/CpxP family protein refolding chaperone